MTISKYLLGLFICFLPSSARCQAQTLVPDSILYVAQRCLLSISELDSVEQPRAVIDLIDDSLVVQCFADKSKGAVVNVNTVNHYFDLTFDQRFFNEIDVLAYNEERLISSFMLVDDHWILSISIQYPYKDPLFPDHEYSRIFKIKFINQRCVLYLISCAG